MLCLIFMTLIILMNLNKDYKMQDVRKKIHLSTDNIKLLRNDTSVSNFINYLMTTPKFHSLLNQLNHICVNGFFSESIETTFSTSAIQKLEKAFHRFSCEVFSVDRNEHTFVPYAKNNFLKREAALP